TRISSGGSGEAAMAPTGWQPSPYLAVRRARPGNGHRPRLAPARPDASSVCTPLSTTHSTFSGILSLARLFGSSVQMRLRNGAARPPSHEAEPVAPHLGLNAPGSLLQRWRKADSNPRSRGSLRADIGQVEAYRSRSGCYRRGNGARRLKAQY